MELDNYKYAQLTKLIIRAFYNVYNKLGYGFLEKVYERALTIELIKLGLQCKRQVPVEVFYDGMCVGNYFADVIVDERVIIEIKAAAGIAEEHEAQLTNYLRATKMEVGMLLNFGKEARMKRKVFSNKFKDHDISRSS